MPKKAKPLKRKSFLDGVILQEAGIQMMVQSWEDMDYEALLMQFSACVLQKSPTRKNVVSYMERVLRAANEKAKRRRCDEVRPD